MRSMLLAAMALFVSVVRANPVVIDDFRDASRWRAAASDQVKAALRVDRDGALCLDYDFAGVSGYAFIRRELPLTVPQHYAFDLRLRGSGPPNDLQIKFTDASGDNVWWLNRQNFKLPASSTTLRIKQRQIQFAWGPTQDRTLRSAAAIEFVIAASLAGGGKGSLCLERLTLLELPPPSASAPPVRVTASAGRDAAAVFDQRSDTAWRAPAGRQTLTFDFGAPRELNGALLRWQAGAHARDYDVEASDDGRKWKVLRRVRGSDGGHDALFMPETETRHLRLVLHRGPGRDYALTEIELPEPEQWPHIDAVFKSLAGLAPRGRYPRAYLSQQNYWTLVGVDGGAEHSALISRRRRHRTRPRRTQRRTLRAPCRRRHRVVGGRAGVAFAARRLPADSGGALDASVVHARHRSRRRRQSRRFSAARALHAAQPHRARAAGSSCVLALRPFQVNPPQQFLSTPGGTSAVRTIEWRDDTLHVNGRAAVRPTSPPQRVIGSSYDAGPIVEAGTPLSQLEDPNGLAEAAIVHSIVLPPNGTQQVGWIAPLAGAASRASGRRRRRSHGRGRRALARAPQSSATAAAAAGAAHSRYVALVAGAHPDVAQRTGAATRHALVRAQLDPRRGDDGSGPAAARRSGRRARVPRLVRAAHLRQRQGALLHRRARRRSGGRERQPRAVHLCGGRSLAAHARPCCAGTHVAEGRGRDALHGQAAAKRAHTRPTAAATAPRGGG